ncbi:MATE family efflux transporter [Gemella sp. GH3]|uniref:MATE family efflux transporter n=1 Tax=unclassified Gemella TaxID=2624949 RepID=UPI0015D073E2|nr:MULTISPECIES: MATE family efflux transporter [unclassified Gemella]MBF0713806.1 MATE family efflux transporter [Gemella sp. GH3.1]NYS50758.1 MATE family efflux transporter [Gemella sp. GH3]
MYNATTTKEQIIVFMKLLVPVLIYQMISYSSGMIGTFMAGHYSSTDLAGLSMGVNIWTPILSILTTLVAALVPIVSQLIGKGEEEQVPTKVRQFIYISLILSIIIAVLLNLSSDYVVTKLGIRDDIAAITIKFLKYQSLGIIPITLYVVLRSFIDSLGLTRISMIIMLIYVPISIVLSYIFIFGKFGLPEFGGAGVAIAINITYIISFIMALIVILNHPKISKYKIFKLEGVKVSHWPEIFKLGIPMIIAVALESFMFSVLSLMVSKFDTATIAAHQSSLNFSGFLYALPMSISGALTIIVAYHIGSKEYKVADKYVKIGVFISIVFSIIGATVIAILNRKIPYLYGTDPSFVNIASQLLYFVIAFLIFDSFSASLIGVMRAYKKVIPTCIFMFIGFYVVGVPLAYYLVFIREVGVYGLWISWLFGLAIYAILMVTYYFRVIKKKYS